MAGNYDTQFYNVIRSGCVQSAETVAPIVFDLVQPATVVDVGCGEGHWGAAFAALGCEAAGVDGDYVPADRRRLEQFHPADLSQPGSLNVGQFDLAVCLEVAEHLPKSRARTFVADLTTLAPVVLFSAAIPGQGGTGHVNEQWPAYWADLFAEHGYSVSGALRWQLWADDRVENWYRQNLLVATSDPARFPTLFDTPLAEPLPLVHPVLYDARRR